MTFNIYMIVAIVAGLVLAFLAGRTALQRNWPICLMLVWLSLANLFALFLRLPVA